MRKLNLTVSFLFTAIIIAIVYALLDGIVCGSGIGIALALGSLVAMFVCFKLFKRLVNENEESNG